MMKTLFVISLTGLLVSIGMVFLTAIVGCLLDEVWHRETPWFGIGLGFIGFAYMFLPLVLLSAKH